MFLANCGPGLAPRNHLEPKDADDCRTLDSLFSASGLRAAITMSGKVTIDVKQYRVRGRFEMTKTARGDLTLEFTSTAALGGHREDIVFSYYADTLRVLDRERGQYYEAEEVDRLVSDGTGVGWDLVDVLSLITLRPHGCDRFESVSRSPSGGGWEVVGRFDGESFSLGFAEGRIREAHWPVFFDGRRDDRLRVNYEWAPGAGGGIALSKMVVYLEERRWRIKLGAN